MFSLIGKSRAIFALILSVGGLSTPGQQRQARISGSGATRKSVKSVASRRGQLARQSTCFIPYSRSTAAAESRKIPPVVGIAYWVPRPGHRIQRIGGVDRFVRHIPTYRSSQLNSSNLPAIPPSSAHLPVSGVGSYRGRLRPRYARKTPLGGRCICLVGVIAHVTATIHPSNQDADSALSA